MRHRPARRSPPSLACAVLLAAGLAFAAGCGTPTKNPVTGQTERTVMDEQTEVAEGTKAHQQILQEYGELKNPKLQAYVNDIGQKLARQSHRANLKWTFTVLDSPEVNAFALPGGFVYVTRGIMGYMQSEADLAGVIGHEIGHVTARHGAQRATRQQRAGVGVVAATVLGVLAEVAGVSGAAQAAQQVSQSVAAGYIASYSREQESQSDKLGAEYLQRVGYDPRNMIDVIGVLKNQERFAIDAAKAEGRQVSEGTNWLASHPSNDQRLADITRIANEYKGKYVDEGRARYFDAINGMGFGESREQGVTRGRNFYHETLGFAFTAPQGWKIDNDADSLTFIAGDGSAGLIVRPVPPKAGNTHDEIIKNAIKPTSGRTEARTLNGLKATYFEGVRRNEQGQNENVRATIATGPSNANYVFIYAAKDQASMNRHVRGLQETESSFRALSAADRTAARPWTVKVVPFPRGGFAELARQSPITTNPEGQLRLLNGAYGGGAEPKAGDPVKVVQ
jgi:predicted Zn-dependent protease